MKHHVVALPRGIAVAFVLAAFTAILAGCFMPLDTPNIELTVDPAYNDSEILIPYSLWGSGSSAQARWTLRRYDTGTLGWIDLDGNEVRLPNGSSGVLQLGVLDEAKYELTFELLTTRDGSYDAVPYLTQRREFFVDRTAPMTPTTIAFYQDGSPVASPAFFTHAEVEIFAPFADPVRESPSVILARIDEALPPLSEHARPSRFTIWDSGYGGPGITLYYVAVDEAGNRGDVYVVPIP